MVLETQGTSSRGSCDSSVHTWLQGPEIKEHSGCVFCCGLQESAANLVPVPEICRAVWSPDPPQGPDDPVSGAEERRGKALGENAGLAWGEKGVPCPTLLGEHVFTGAGSHLHTLLTVSWSPS